VFHSDGSAGEASQSYRISESVLEIVQGDIIDQHVDAIVNAQPQ